MNDRAQWLAERRRGIGGSDIAAIIGLSPWRTPMDVYLDKRGELEDVEPKNPEALYWGTVLEDVVASEYGRRTGRKVQRVNTMLRHATLLWALANIDRAVINPEIAGTVRWKDDHLTTDRIVECKTANGFAAAAWGEPGTDQVPEYYIPQPQWYMGITGARYCDVPVLIGGNDFRIYTIERDDDLIAHLFEAGAAFWQRILDGIAPDPQTTEDARRLWASHLPGKRVIVDVTVAQACDEILALQEQAKAIEAREAELKLALMRAIGDAEEASYMGRKLATWRNNKPSTVTDWKGIVAAIEPPQDVIDEHTAIKPGARVLRIAKVKE